MYTFITTLDAPEPIKTPDLIEPRILDTEDSIVKSFFNSSTSNLILFKLTLKSFDGTTLKIDHDEF